MNKREKIEKAKREFLECNGSFLEKCKLAEIYLDVVRRNGSLNLIIHSKEWKENRAKKLKDCCETCGSKDGLHISHTWHPPHTAKMQSHVVKVHGKKCNEPIPYEVEKHSCPVCDSTSVKFLKTQQKWKCYAQRTEFKPHIQHEIEQWEKTKDNDGVRDFYYQKYDVDTDEKVVGSIQGYVYYTQERKVYADMSLDDLLEKLENDTLEVIETVAEHRHRPSRNYYRNRHKVSCGAVFEDPNVKTTQKKIDSDSVWMYYYALEKITLTERYIEMRDSDILTECKKCGFERDKQRILEKKARNMGLKELRNKYKDSFCP
tara:strand:+ start:52 stop:1002 length:951 start_codon:yes stop_codon:yes gene_type:complete